MGEHEGGQQAKPHPAPHPIQTACCQKEDHTISDNPSSGLDDPFNYRLPGLGSQVMPV